MIVETKNSTYEIKDLWVRKIKGEPSDNHEINESWTLMDHLLIAGGRLILFVGDIRVRTSTITSVTRDPGDN